MTIRRIIVQSLWSELQCFFPLWLKGGKMLAVFYCIENKWLQKAGVLKSQLEGLYEGRHPSKSLNWIQKEEETWCKPAEWRLHPWLFSAGFTVPNGMLARCMVLSFMLCISLRPLVSWLGKWRGKDATLPWPKAFGQGNWSTTPPLPNSGLLAPDPKKLQPLAERKMGAN